MDGVDILWRWIEKSMRARYELIHEEVGELYFVHNIFNAWYYQMESTICLKKTVQPSEESTITIWFPTNNPECELWRNWRTKFYPKRHSEKSCFPNENLRSINCDWTNRNLCPSGIQLRSLHSRFDVAYPPNCTSPKGLREWFKSLFSHASATKFVLPSKWIIMQV